MFEEASRLKLRFDTGMGFVTVEDLWDIPLTGRGFDLDDLAKSLNRAVKDSEEESFVVKKNTENKILSLKFDIVKHVIKTKLEEAEESEKAAEVKAKKQRILAILADKQDEELKSKSADELKDLLGSL